MYEQLKELKFADIERDGDPLNTFRYYAGLYYSAKTIEQQKATFLERVSQHPDVSNVRTLAAKKKLAIAATITECMQDLETLIPEHERYQETRSKRVIEWIEKLRRDNEGLLSQHYTFRLFKPRPGLLEDVLTKAVGDIKMKKEGDDEDEKDQTEQLKM